MKPHIYKKRGWWMVRWNEATVSRFLTCALLACTILNGGCASYMEIREHHPVVTRVVEGSLVLSAAGALYAHKHRDEAVQTFPDFCGPDRSACK